MMQRPEFLSWGQRSQANQACPERSRRAQRTQSQQLRCKLSSVFPCKPLLGWKTAQNLHPHFNNEAQQPQRTMPASWPVSLFLPASPGRGGQRASNEFAEILPTGRRRAAPLIAKPEYWVMYKHACMLTCYAAPPECSDRSAWPAIRPGQTTGA